MDAQCETIQAIEIMTHRASRIMRAQSGNVGDGVRGALKVIEVRRAETLIDTAIDVFASAYMGPEFDEAHLDDQARKAWSEINEMRSKIQSTLKFYRRGRNSRPEDDDLVHVNLIFR